MLSEDADVVRIMSIHKSKGLEYPVVFVAGMGRQFNRMELKDNVQVHPDYYLAAMAMHIKGRYKHNTAIRSIYAALEDAEMMAENLRVLYVAMTRAKEKLILTGAIRGADRLLAKYAYVEDMEPLLLPYNVRKMPTAMRSICLPVWCVITDWRQPARCRGRFVWRFATRRKF